MHIDRAGFNYAKIFFFFLKKVGEKKKGTKKKTKTVLQSFPRSAQLAGTCSFLASSPPSGSPSDLPGGSVADPSQAGHMAILGVSVVSAQMGRQEKSLSDEASEGW